MIVIGGGIVGAATAWHAAECGAEVVLYERGTLASGATGRSQGLVLPPDHAELELLWRESVVRYLRLAESHQIGLDREPVGTLMLATAADQLAALDAMARQGERLDPAGVAAAEPALAPGMAGGTLLAEGRRSDPTAVTAALAAAARAAGADGRPRAGRAARAGLDRPDRTRRAAAAPRRLRGRIHAAGGPGAGAGGDAGRAGGRGPGRAGGRGRACPRDPPEPRRHGHHR